MFLHKSLQSLHSGKLEQLRIDAISITWNVKGEGKSSLSKQLYFYTGRNTRRKINKLRKNVSVFFLCGSLKVFPAIFLPPKNEV